MNFLLRHSPFCVGKLESVEAKLRTESGDYILIVVQDVIHGRVKCFLPEDDWPIVFFRFSTRIDFHYFLIAISPTGEKFGSVLPLKFQTIEVQREFIEVLSTSKRIKDVAAELPCLEENDSIIFMDSLKGAEFREIAKRLDDLYEFPSSDQNIEPT